MNKIDNSSIQAMVAQLRAMASQATVPSKAADVAPDANLTGGKVEFGDVLKAALDKVEAAHENAEAIGKRFALGDSSVSISDVMIAEQKAGIAMQATLQVRNRLISAYTSIMNMSV